MPFASSIEDAERSVVLRVPEDQGRRYAAVCKDYNPIHLHKLSAKLFGFKRAIAHGMWVMARSLSESIERAPAEKSELEVSFKRPVLLPCSVLITSRQEGEALQVAVTTPDGAIPHLRSTLTQQGDAA